MKQRQGGCLCGNIRYEALSQPMRVTICHCRFCQRATGSAYLVEPIFASSDLVVGKGRPKIYQHRSEGSGKMVDVHFCAECGTKLFLTFERFDNVTGVYGGTFDDPNWFDRSADNSRHIFLGVAQNGVVVPAGLDTYEEHATTNDGQSVTPRVFGAHHLIEGKEL